MLDETEPGDASSAKKARVVWTVNLHQKFVRAVNLIGYDKVGPKKIFDLMGVPWLTRENVASHLQKYRLYLNRLQKENDLKATLSGIKFSDFSSNGASGNACLQNSAPLNSVEMPQNDVANAGFFVRGDMESIYTGDSKLDGDFERVISTPMAKSDSVYPPNSSTSMLSFSRSFGTMCSDVNYEPNIQDHYSCSEVLPTQLKLEQESLLMRPVQADSVKLTHASRSFCGRENNPTETEMKPSFNMGRSQGIGKVTKVESMAALFSVEPENHLISRHALEPISFSNRHMENKLFDGLKTSQKNHVLANESIFMLQNGELRNYHHQGDFCPSNASSTSVESFGFSNMGLISDALPHLYESTNIGYENPSDSLEYPVMEQALFIA